MHLREPSGPDLSGVVADANAVGLEYVVIGGFSVVGFKRLANRPVDRTDLEELEAIYGRLPIEPIPGLDDQD